MRIFFHIYPTFVPANSTEPPKQRCYTIIRYLTTMMNTRTPLSCSRYFLTSSRIIRKKNATALEINERRFFVSKPVVAQEMTKKVKQYGKLFIDLPCNVEVKPTDAHDYPDMDTLIVKLTSSESDEKEIDDVLSIDVTGDLCRITAKDNDRFERPSDTQCVIEIPIQSDVDVRTLGNSGVSISSMVSNLIKAETEKGNITGTKLQGNKIRFYSSQGGSINLHKSVQGDIAIETAKNGSIKTEKCLGTKLEMRTENGDISLGSNYCERAIFTTVNGNMCLNNLHMDASVDISGKGFLNVSCLDGCLRANLRDGETKVHVARLTGKSHIISEGPVHLIVPRDNNIRLTLKGNKVSLNDDTKQTIIFKADDEIPFDVETKRDIKVTAASWAESLQLGKFGK